MKLLVIPFGLLISTVLIEANFIHRRHDPPFEDIPDKLSTKIPQCGRVSQPVDHFNPRDLTYWPMRYLYNDQFFEAGGPIIIFIGGEWKIAEHPLRSGQVFDIAKELKGYMFYTEHRFYGDSYPLPAFDPQGLHYLSVDQALADIVYFVKFVKENIDGLQNSKVVVVGCSYAGAMATWIRLKYPHVIDAAYASSAPVKAVMDFPEYYGVVSHNIAAASKQCFKTVSDGISQLQNKLRTHEGFEEMTYEFRDCRKGLMFPEKSFFFNTIAGKFSLLSQREDASETKKVCDRMARISGTALDKLIDFVQMQCRIPRPPDDPRMWWAWTYQTCTEFGYFQTKNASEHIFGDVDTLDSNINNCYTKYNVAYPALHDGIERTNLFYGGDKPQVTKLVSVLGTADPWHVLGLLEDLNELAPAIVINRTHHCADLRNNFHESQEMKQAKARVRQLIAEWIS